MAAVPMLSGPQGRQTELLRKALVDTQAHITEKASDFMRSLALEATRRLVFRTPVDTGRARGNWHLSSGNPSDEVDVDRFDPTGEQSMAEAGARLPDVGITEPAYVVNNLVYIGRLEAGHSPQCPPGGMIALTVAELGPLAEGLVTMIAHGKPVT